MQRRNDELQSAVREGWRRGMARHGDLRVSFSWYALYALRAASRYQDQVARQGREIATAEALRDLRLEDIYVAAACDSASAAAWIHLEKDLIPRVARFLRAQGAGREQAYDVAYGIPGALYTAPAAQGGAAPFADYTGRGPLLGWLCAIGRGRLHDRWRERTRRGRRQAEAVRRREQIEPESPTAPRPAEVARRTLRATQRAVADMSECERAFFSLRGHRGLLQVEIARRMGVTPARVSRLKQTVFGRLRRRLSAEDVGPSVWGASREVTRAVALEVVQVAGRLDALCPA